MKQKIIILLTTSLLLNSGLSAQNIEKMSKSELRNHIIFLSTSIDSIKNENINLQESINKLSENSSLLEKKNKKNELEISRLNELILKNENEIKRIISENETTKSKLNEEILTLKDSISGVRSRTNVVSTSTTFNSNDFLNKYYFDQVPLPNNSYSLVLTKLIYGNSLSSHINYYDDYDNMGGVQRLPEILDPDSFTYWGVKPNVDTKNKDFNDLIFANNSEYLNSKLPRIEILKNKLFTLKYINGTEESFLFNVNKTGSADNNNQRGILQIELANEEVKEDGQNNTAKDMVWRFFVIGNECYLALNLNQLNRIDLKLFNPNTIEYYHDGQYRKDVNFSYNYNAGTTSGNGVYLSRNIDSYMESSNYINPNELIYLF